MMNIILTMSSFLFPIITFPYISRILLPVGMGKVSFAFSIINYFLLIAQLGIPTYGIRACARIKDDRYELNKTVQEIFTISVYMCIVSYILLAIALCCIPRFQEEQKLLMIISTSIFFTTLGVEWFFKAMEMYSYITWRSIICKFVALGAIFLLVHDEKDYLIYGGISIFSSSASGILNFLYFYRLVDLRRSLGFNLKKHIKPILIFFAMSCATTVYLNLDTTMLGFMKTDEDVGYYNAAVKVKNILVSMVTSLGTVLLPRITVYLKKNDNEKFKNLSIKAIHFVMFISIPMLIYFIIFAKASVLLLSGEEYQKSVLPMRFMMPTLLFIGLTNIMGIQMLVPLGKEDKVLISVILGAVVDLILNSVLIPRYSVLGAAIGTMVAELVVFIYQYFSDRNLFREIFASINPIKIIIATFCASVASSWVLVLEIEYWECVVISGVCFVGVYLISVYLLRESFVWDIFNIIMGKGKNKVFKN